MAASFSIEHKNGQWALDSQTSTYIFEANLKKSKSRKIIACWRSIESMSA